MLANWVKESTATTGTGTLSLGGAASGFVPFSAAFATGDLVLYTIEDGNNRETGIGTLTSGSPWTLARTRPMETLVAGTYSNATPSAISLSGSATVGISAARQSIMPELQSAPIKSGDYFIPANFSGYSTSTGKGGGEFTAQSGRITLTPMLLLTPTKISAIGASLAGASAGGLFRVGIYSAKSDGSPGSLLVDSGDLSTSSAVAVFATLGSPLWLPAGNYFSADAVNNTTATANCARGASINNRFGGTGGATGQTRPYYDQTYGAFPSTLPAPTGYHAWGSFGIIYK